MPSFKPKSVKKIKINKKNSTTLDGKHREFMNDFNKDEMDKIPKLKEERSSLKKRLQKIENGESIENNPTIEQGFVVYTLTTEVIDVEQTAIRLKLDRSFIKPCSVIILQIHHLDGKFAAYADTGTMNTHPTPIVLSGIF